MVNRGINYQHFPLIDNLKFQRCGWVDTTFVSINKQPTQKLRYNRVGLDLRRGNMRHLEKVGLYSVQLRSIIVLRFFQVYQVHRKLKLPVGSFFLSEVIQPVVMSQVEESLLLKVGFRIALGERLQSRMINSEHSVWAIHRVFISPECDDNKLFKFPRLSTVTKVTTLPHDICKFQEFACLALVRSFSSLIDQLDESIYFLIRVEWCFCQQLFVTFFSSYPLIVLDFFLLNFLLGKRLQLIVIVQKKLRSLVFERVP